MPLSHLTVCACVFLVALVSLRVPMFHFMSRTCAQRVLWQILVPMRRRRHSLTLFTFAFTRRCSPAPAAFRLSSHPVPWARTCRNQVQQPQQVSGSHHPRTLGQLYTVTLQINLKISPPEAAAAALAAASAGVPACAAICRCRVSATITARLGSSIICSRCGTGTGTGAGAGARTGTSHLRDQSIWDISPRPKSTCVHWNIKPLRSCTQRRVARSRASARCFQSECWRPRIAAETFARRIISPTVYPRPASAAHIMLLRQYALACARVHAHPGMSRLRRERKGSSVDAQEHGKMTDDTNVHGNNNFPPFLLCQNGHEDTEQQENQRGHTVFRFARLRDRVSMSCQGKASVVRLLSRELLAPAHLPYSSTRVSRST